MSKKSRNATNRSDLVRELARRNPQISPEILGRYVDEVFEAIAQALVDGRRVELRGFGSFWTKQRGERLSRNPRTGESVFVPAKRVPAFRPGRLLRNQLIRAAETNETPGATGQTDPASTEPAPEAESGTHNPTD